MFKKNIAFANLKNWFKRVFEFSLSFIPQVVAELPAKWIKGKIKQKDIKANFKFAISNVKKK